MKKIPIAAAEEVEQELPDLADLVQANGTGPVALVFADFEKQERLFYNVVWYSISHGRRVVIEASEPPR